jgi:Tol biopolymer transport system component
MSPEQALGRKVDTVTDIFSLGVVLYEMATGRLPFNGESVTETIDRIVHAQPDAMGRFNYDVPEELERIVKKALRKSRDQRYQSARDLLVDLQNLKRDLGFATQSQNLAPEGANSPGNVRSVRADTGAATARETQTAAAHATSSAEYIVGEIKRHKISVTVAALTLIAAMVAIPILLKRYLWTHQPISPSTGKTMKSKRLLASATAGKAGNTSISPDGKFVVYKDDEADRRQGLWIRQVATGVSRQIVASEEVQYAGTTFSRDGNLIYYVVLGTKYPSGALFQVPVNGGNAKQLLVNISGPITQSPNAKQIAYADGTSLMMANVDGTSARKLATIYGIGLQTAPAPAWSPDGKVIAYGSKQSGARPHASVFSVEVASGEVKQLTNYVWSSVRRLVWFGDGSGLVFLASDLDQDYSQVWEISYPSGAVRRITNDLNGHGHVSLGLTADSTTLVTQQEDDICQVWIMPHGDSSNARQLTFGQGQTDGRFGLAWSANGRLIYSARVETGWNLSHIKTDGTQQDSITVNAYRDEYPAVTPDGQTIVFQSTRGTGIYHLWTMDSKGGQLKQLTTGENAEDNTARVSPDGRWVLYSSHTAGQERIWKVPIEGGQPVQLTDFQSKSPDVSPDGKSVACVFLDETVHPARWRIAIFPLVGGPPVKTIDLPPTADISRSTFGTRSVTYVRWLPGRSALAYVDLKNGVSNVWSQPIDGGPPSQLTNFPSGLIFNFALSPDGKQIACARGTRTSDVILITDFR